MGKRLKRVLLLLLPVLLVGGAILASGHLPSGGDLLGAARELVDHPLVRALSSVTRPFVEVFVAGSPGAYLGWTVAAVAILGVLFGLVMLFDVAYTERAVAASRKMHERLRRMRSGGGPIAPAGRTRIRLAAPRLPWLGGAGPMVWRQYLEMARSLRSIVLANILMLGPVIAIIVFTVIADAPSPTDPGAAAARSGPPIAVFVAILAFMTFLSGQHVNFDFRRDLDRMAYLKSLPLAPRGLAAAQLVPGTLLLFCVQAAALGILALATGSVPAELLAGLLLVLPPLDWLTTAIDNTLFLLWPYRQAQKEAGFPFMGRVMLVMLLKMIALGALCLAGFLLGALVWYLTGALLASALAVALLLAGACVPGTLVVARAFEKFDISRDLPS
jgi:hypothetical protein